MRPTWLLNAALLVGSVSKSTASLSLLDDPYYLTFRSACPAPCPSSGTGDSNEWTTYHNSRPLNTCEEPMLLDFTIHNSLDDPSSHRTLRACTPSNTTDSPTSLSSPSCAPSNIVHVDIETAWHGPDAPNVVSHVQEATQRVLDKVQQQASCNTAISFGHANSATVGVYIGSSIQDGENVMQTFLNQWKSGALAKSTSLMQLCGDGRVADSILGIIAATGPSPESNLAAVQNAAASWAKGKCVTGYEKMGRSKSSIVMTDASSRPAKRALTVVPRAHCSALKVSSGDSCSSLAKKCGISKADFTKYNPNHNLCSHLQPGQHVCCSPGSLPDYSPKPNADGTCATHTVKTGDTCSAIASDNSLAEDEISSFNKQTWGWMGCNDLQIGQKICLSKGEPPMPADVKNAVCGPQVAGTKRPKDWANITMLNPCPLNACCDIWGQCGTTDEFCAKTESPTGSPGTAAAGTNGCISNCGTEVLMNGTPELMFRGIGYFEAWSMDRPCLTLEAWQVDLANRSALQYAFASITTDYKVNVSQYPRQWEGFLTMNPSKRVLSFGGWAFSTALDSYSIFRQGVTDAHRETFATNVVQFLEDNDLAGLDFDWEYPGAPDIPGIPPGSPEDGPNYVQFLKLVREKLPKGKTLSIAAPASYWYLKGFPIVEISKVVDYIVYMTYDLHGQWDYGVSYPGCPGGNCLQSHVNYTDIVNSFSMITKAGVANSKIVAGIPTYGRSFGMVDPSCTGPGCRFTGPRSGAMPGPCTQTPGFLANAEIKQIIHNAEKDGTSLTQYWDPKSRSTIAYWNDTWVAYLNETELFARQYIYSFDFAMSGYSIWAVDLESYRHTAINDDVWDWTPPNCDETYTSIDAINDATNIPEICVNLYLIQALHHNLTGTLEFYNDILGNGYDTAYGYYRDQIKATAPDQLRQFVLDNTNKYFSCEDSVPDKTGANHPSYHNVSSSCPGNSKHPYTSYWMVKDEKTFFSDLTSATGIMPDWVQFGNFHYFPDCIEDCEHWGWWRGYPMMKDDYTVANPKEIVSRVYTNLTKLEDTLSWVELEAQYNVYPSKQSDVVDGSSLLVFMVSSAVQNMQQVLKIGEKIEKQKAKQVIELFLSFLLLIIPGLGEVAAAADMANLARMLALIGDAGNGAMSIYDVVEAKGNSPMAIFGALLSGFALTRAGKSFGEAATARRAMSEASIAKLGTEVQSGMGKISKSVKACY